MELTKKKSELTSLWRDIDADILLQIATYIPLTLLPHLGVVCSRWHRLLTPKIWSHIYKGFGSKRNKMDILKKYGKFVEFMEPGTLEVPEVGQESWLDYCPLIWYYYLPLYVNDQEYSYDLLSFKKLPKRLQPIPLYSLSYGEDWMNLVLLWRMLETPPIIEGYYLNCLEEPAIRLQSIPLDMKENVKVLQIAISEYFSIDYLVKVIQGLPNLTSLNLNFLVESSVEEWGELEKLLTNTGKLSHFKLTFNALKYKQLQDREIDHKETLNYSTEIKSLDFGLPYKRASKVGLPKIYKNIDFNFFQLFILACPMLTEITIPVIDYNIVTLLGNNCPNLTKLCAQTSFPVFFEHTPCFTNLKYLSVSSLDDVHFHMIYGFNTIFPNVTHLYIDHYFAHLPEYCIHHPLSLLPQLFPKLTSLKLSHDISDNTLERLLSHDGPLHLTHLYLHSPINRWTNLIELIRHKCPNLHTIVYEWCTDWHGYDDCPIHELLSQIPPMNVFIAKFAKPFEYQYIYRLDDFVNRKLLN